MQFDDFYTQIQCEEVYDDFLDLIEFRGLRAIDEIFVEMEAEDE